MVASTHHPSFNIDKLEGAVRQMLLTCGALTFEAIDDFARRYAYYRGKRLPENYTRDVLLKRMTRKRLIYKTTSHHYSSHPLYKTNPAGLNAFWVFLENMEDVPLETVQCGNYPAQITYVKNNKIYHIVSCKGNGAVEMGMAVQNEIETARRYKKGNISPVQERYFFVFNSEEDMKNAPCVLQTPSMYCVITYPNGHIPTLSFSYPSNVNSNVN